ncbi:MAG: heme peroxidase, partial [Proteobacteria bacterium]|nr:heme peroxidase [Pseudomonadota bacterium]
ADVAAYTLSAADVGTQISVRVGYTDGHGTAESLTSAPTAIVISGGNSPPQGSPLITGTVTEDEDLGVDTNGISDANGLGAFSYQWIRDGVDIAGATSATYTLGDADVDKPISVRVDYIDGQGFNESLTSAPTAAVANVNDAPAGVPIITGTTTEDQVLSADANGITDIDGLGAFSYQWLRNGVDIAGANADTYTLDDADVGQQISVRASYIDGYGAAESVTSAPTAAIANINDAPAGVPTLDNTAPLVGQTIVASNTFVDPDGVPGAVDYQWQSSTDGSVWSNIGGVVGSTFTVTTAQAGLLLRAVATYTDTWGTAETVTSAATAQVPTISFNVIDGTSAGETLIGTAADDQINGLGGSDTIDGGLGTDLMVGGTGSDTYTVDNVGDGIIENLNEGTDTVLSSVNYTLGSNVERLTLTGSAISGTGNELGNILRGTNSGNTISGLDGNDTIFGNGGVDT